MTEKELKKLNRKQLLELLLKQTERADDLQRQLDEAEKKLQDKVLLESEAGSIAEAALKLNGIFEAADAAASQYLDNIKRISEDKDTMALKAEEEARSKAKAILEETEKRCRAREEKAEMIVKQASAKLSQMYKQKKSLDSIFKDFAVKQENGNK